VTPEQTSASLSKGSLIDQIMTASLDRANCILRLTSAENDAVRDYMSAIATYDETIITLAGMLTEVNDAT
jgi:hypothetical protein